MRSIRCFSCLYTIFKLILIVLDWILTSLNKESLKLRFISVIAIKVISFYFPIAPNVVTSAFMYGSFRLRPIRTFGAKKKFFNYSGKIRVYSSRPPTRRWHTNVIGLRQLRQLWQYWQSWYFRQHGSTKWKMQKVSIATFFCWYYILTFCPRSKSNFFSSKFNFSHWSRDLILWMYFSPTQEF